MCSKQKVCVCVPAPHCTGSVCTARLPLRRPHGPARHGAALRARGSQPEAAFVPLSGRGLSPPSLVSTGGGAPPPPAAPEREQCRGWPCCRRACPGCGDRRGSLRERPRRRPARTKGGLEEAAPRGRGRPGEPGGCGAVGSRKGLAAAGRKVRRGPLAAGGFVWRNRSFGEGMRRAAAERGGRRGGGRSAFPPASVPGEGPGPPPPLWEGVKFPAVRVVPRNFGGSGGSAEPCPVRAAAAVSRRTRRSTGLFPSQPQMTDFDGRWGGGRQPCANLVGKGEGTAAGRDAPSPASAAPPAPHPARCPHPASCPPPASLPS